MPDAPTDRAIDQIRAAYSGAMRSIVVPEWNDLELKFGPVTVADMQSVEDRKPKDFQERNLYLLILKARGSDGTPAFQMGDKHVLATEADYMVLQRVINFMYEAAITAKEAEELVAADPPSASAST